MCGIAGIYAYHYAANAVDRAELQRIRDHMAARGPDGFGEWYSQDERVALGHRRLTIIDLSERGAQPMTSADGKLVVTFNGEIYNFRALRAELHEATALIVRAQVAVGQLEMAKRRISVLQTHVAAVRRDLAAETARRERRPPR